MAGSPAGIEKALRAGVDAHLLPCMRKLRAEMSRDWPGASAGGCPRAVALLSRARTTPGDTASRWRGALQALVWAFAPVAARQPSSQVSQYAPNRNLCMSHDTSPQRPRCVPSCCPRSTA